MPILRAGPWAEPFSLTNPFNSLGFVDPVTDFSTEPDAFPVNICLKDWVSDTWKAVWILSRDNGIFDDAGVTDQSGYNATGLSNEAWLELVFFYQSKLGFSLDFNWLVDSGTSGIGYIWSWRYDTIEGLSDNDGVNSLSGSFNSGTETIAVPAATIGIVRLTVQAGEGEDTERLQITVNET